MKYLKKTLALLTVTALVIITLFSTLTAYANEPLGESKTEESVNTEIFTTEKDKEESENTRNLPEIDPIEDGAVYRIKNLKTGRYLTLEPNANGVYDATLNNIGTANYNGSSAQEFRIEDNFGTYYIRAIKSSNGTNRLVDVYSSNINQIVDGANVHLHPPGDENSSQWLIEYNATLGSYVIKIACKPNLAITDVSGDARINTFPKTEPKPEAAFLQYWIFERVTESVSNIISSEKYRIKDLNSGLYLSVSGNDADLSNVELATGNISLLNQQFRIVYDEANEMYYIKAMMSSNGTNRVLDIYSNPNSLPVDGRNVHIYVIELFENYNSCGWQIKKLGTDENGNEIVKIVSDYNNSLALTAANGGTTAGTNVRVNTYTNYDHQRWVIEKVVTVRTVNITYQGDNKIKVGNTAVESDETLQLSINQYGLTTSDFEWRSSHDTVADVNNNGVVEGKAAGAATITATCTVNGIYYVGTVEINVFRSIADLQSVFPHGKYWNHIADSAGNVSTNNSPDSVTDFPCRHHTISTSGECPVNGSCGCNSYELSTQCAGFAKYIGAIIYGAVNPMSNNSALYTIPNSTLKWTKIKNYNHSSYSSKEHDEEDHENFSNYVLKPGDIIRNDGHSFIVTSVVGNVIYYVECNSGSPCIIKWNASSKAISQIISESNTSTEHIYSAPYAWE